ncbi:hypothetical protein KY290_003072 [Solanum tuberosum]|uniref:Uncharacterized protein n=1 Tax=Solanum tuberosum TaxID=4113 RepID=A0ABQ7WRW7_SOLTU|nr:hypothetical protein KY285_003040 [Solanum tuberosum]KAH0783474.1 hypothetical protein KY290_003072 [Solanum tuberosum]
MVPIAGGSWQVPRGISREVGVPQGISLFMSTFELNKWKKAWFVPEIYDIPHQGHKSIRKASKQGHMFIFTVGGGQGGELFVRRPMGRVFTCLMATVYQAVTISMWVSAYLFGRRRTMKRQKGANDANQLDKDIQI